MILLIDNYDSFTYNLFQYMRMLGRQVTVVRNDAVDVAAVERMAPELLVFSPGPGRPEAAGACMDLIGAFKERLPMLGICLGMQAIAQSYGGRVGRALAPMHGKVRSVIHDGLGLFAGLPSPLQVTRYHSLVVDPLSLPDCLEACAWSEDGEVMGLRHRHLPVSGVQFHPEAYLTEYGLELLANAIRPFASQVGQSVNERSNHGAA